MKCGRFAISVLVFLQVTRAVAAQLHVAATGGSGGNGTAAQPFQCIAQARDAARSIQGEPVTITIHGGHYLERAGLKLTKADSGQKRRPVKYQGAPGETVRIFSGICVPIKALEPVTEEAILSRFYPEVRNRVRQISLERMGIEAEPLKDRFEGLDLLEVLWNRQRLPIARWPDKGSYARIEKVVDNGLSPGNNGTFLYRGNGPERWQSALQEGVWLRGFWRVPWVIEAVRAGAIDPVQKSITLAVPVPRGIGSKYHRAPGDGMGPGSGEEPWEAINLLEEINEPGEWAVRFADKTLYILPPENEGELLITDHSDPILEMENVSNLTIENLGFECGLGDGLRINNGQNVVIAGCKVAHVARNGIVVNGGRAVTVVSCDTEETGLSGIVYTGGDRRTLTPGGHRILNNIVKRAGLYYPSPGIDGGLKTQAEAVGNLVAHNRIHDCMNSGIVYSGNDNIFEYNEIYRIGLGSSDLGCFYTTGGWTSRGNIVRFNMVHHSMNANAFYVDDGDCGDSFLGNIAYKTASGGFVGGGSDHLFRNNIIVENTRAMHVDARGIPRKYTSEDPRLRADLESVPYMRPPWSKKYPELVRILESHPERPSRVLIENNLFARCEVPIRRSGTEEELSGVLIRNNLVSSDLSMFADVEALDFSIKPEASIGIPGFQPIPVRKIGVHPDDYRALVPPRDLELLRVGNTGHAFDSQTDIDASNRQKKAP